ncbi:MAG: hypothetical protein D6688_08130 [Alphaproteobacteria bacterium]|nr:MAG: hypothetical protein D6688_08130 [Alphaproteobacteria bacterium]
MPERHPDLPRPGVAGWRRILREAEIETCDRLAEISGADPDLAVAAHERFGCRIDLVALDRHGKVSPRAGQWIGAYREALLAAGVPADAIHEVRRESGIERAAIVAGLGRWGMHQRIRNLGPFLDRALSPGGILAVDLAKGSGGFPFLRDYGNCRTVATWSAGGKPVARVVMSVEPSRIGAPDVEWARIAKGLVGRDGFLNANAHHSFTFIPRGPTLCVTFDNLDIAMNKREDRRPWGFAFIERQGWSMLGVMAAGWTWYRDAWVTAEFDRLRGEGFFAGFERVIFYGASMGGYGALAFSAAAPGADVVVFSPQTTLDKAIVPWETRYRVAWDHDYSDHYGDAARTVAAARRVSIFYDPYSRLDARHVDRLRGDNIHLFRAPFLGHRLGSLLSQMGILQPLVLDAMGGTLTEDAFRKAIRARHGFRRYRRELVLRLIDTGHPVLAERLCRKFLTEGPDRFFRETAERLAAQRALGAA